MSAISRFQVGETGCQGRERVSLSPRSMRESNPLLIFWSLSCSLLSSVAVKSFFSCQKALKKKKCWQTAREGVECLYLPLIQEEEETKICSLRQHHTPSWTQSLPLSAQVPPQVREPLGPTIPEPRTGLAGRFAAACFVFKLFISQSLFPPTLLNWTFIFLSCRKTAKSVLVINYWLVLTAPMLVVFIEKKATTCLRLQFGY